MFNDIINTLIRSLPFSTRSAISFGLFFACLIFFNRSLKKTNDHHPLRVGWFVLFILSLALSVIYVTL